MGQLRKRGDIWWIRYSGRVIIAALLACVGCNDPRPPSSVPPTVTQQTERNLEVETATLRLSQMCSTSADAFWRRGGYDRPGKPVKGSTESWSYQSHYNSEQKRCFIAVQLTTMMPSGTWREYQEVFDAVEGGQSLATMNVRRGSVPGIDLLKANEKIETTDENLQWFRSLMSK